MNETQESSKIVVLNRVSELELMAIVCTDALTASAAWFIALERLFRTIDDVDDGAQPRAILQSQLLAYGNSSAVTCMCIHQPVLHLTTDFRFRKAQHVISQARTLFILSLQPLIGFVYTATAQRRRA